MELAWTHTDDNIAKQALQWTPQGHGSRGRPKNTQKIDLDKEIWSTGLWYCTDGGRWRRQQKTELDDRDKWSVFHRERQGVSLVKYTHDASDTW